MADPSNHEVRTITLDDVPAILDRAQVESWTALTLIGGGASYAASPGPHVYVIEEGQLSEILVARLTALTALTSLDLGHNGIGAAGARALLDTWADSNSASSKRRLGLSENDPIGDALPSELFGTTDAQEILAAYRRFRDGLDTDEDAILPGEISADQPRALRFGDDEGRIGGSTGGADGEVVADTAITRDFRDRAALMAERMLAIAAAEAGSGNAYHNLREKAEDLLVALGDAPESIRPALLSALVAEMANALKADDDRLNDPELAERPPLSTELREALANTLESAGRLVAYDDLLASLTKELRDDEVPIPPGQSIIAMSDGAVEAGAASEAARHDLAIVANAAPRSAGNFVRSGIRIA